MKKQDLILLIPIAFMIGSSFWAINTFTGIQTSIMETIHTPTNVDVLPTHMNEDLTCHKVGLYTDWDEGWTGKLTGYLTGIYAGEHARQMFFEYNCSLTCYNYWESNKICLAELYPHG